MQGQQGECSGIVTSSGIRCSSRCGGTGEDAFTPAAQAQVCSRWQGMLYDQYETVLRTPLHYSSGCPLHHPCGGHKIP